MNRRSGFLFPPEPTGCYVDSASETWLGSAIQMQSNFHYYTVYHAVLFLILLCSVTLQICMLICSHSLLLLLNLQQSSLSFRELVLPHPTIFCALSVRKTIRDIQIFTRLAVFSPSTFSSVTTQSSYTLIREWVTTPVVRRATRYDYSKI